MRLLRPYTHRSDLPRDAATWPSWDDYAVWPGPLYQYFTLYRDQLWEIRPLELGCAIYRLPDTDSAIIETEPTLIHSEPWSTDPLEDLASLRVRFRRIVDR